MIETVQQLLRRRRDDDTRALVYGDRTWTWREHLAEAEAEAAALTDRADPSRPLHVGALLTNSPAMLRAMAAAALGGYVLCGINTTRRGAGLLTDIRRSDCQILLVDGEHRPLLKDLDLSGIQVIDVNSAGYADAVYGTRCSTVVAIDRDGQGVMVERRFAANGDTTGETSLTFSWSID